MLRVFAAVVALAALTGFAMAATCQSVNTVKADLIKAFPTSPLREAGKDEAASMIAMIDITTGEHYSADYAVVLDDPKYPGVMIVFFETGCATRMAFPPRGVFKKMLEAL